MVTTVFTSLFFIVMLMIFLFLIRVDLEIRRLKISLGFSYELPPVVYCVLQAWLFPYLERQHLTIVVDATAYPVFIFVAIYNGKVVRFCDLCGPVSLRWFSFSVALL